jgi:hypothetical protein
VCKRQDRVGGFIWDKLYKGVREVIEVVLSGKEYVRFTAEAKKRMHINGLDMNELAKQIDRPAGSVRNFFSDKGTPSRFIAAEIAQILEMEIKDWK